MKEYWILTCTLTFFLAPCLAYSVGAKIQQSAGCYHNGTIYAERSLIPTIEPCLTCRCANKSLVCALKVCPEQVFPPPRGCVLVQPKRACCPYLSCKTFRYTGLHNNDLDISRLDTLNYDELASNDDLQRSDDDIDLFEENNVCIEDGSVYGSGSAMVSSNFCSYCYCFAGKRVCVKPKCLLPNHKCRPLYASGSCCPVHYDCDERNATINTNVTDHNGENSVTQYDIGLTNRNYNKKKTKVPEPKVKCLVNNTYFFDGQKLPTNKENPCEMCFCIRGSVMCTPKKCAPYIGNCIPIIPDGECCAIGYECRTKTNETTRHFRQDDSEDFDLFSLLFGPEKQKIEQNGTILTSQTSASTISPTITTSTNTTTATTNQPFETTSKKGIFDSFLSFLGTDGDDDDEEDDDEIEKNPTIPPFKQLSESQITTMETAANELVSTELIADLTTVDQQLLATSPTTLKNEEITEILATEINTMTNVPFNDNFVNQSSVAATNTTTTTTSTSSNIFSTMTAEQNKSEITSTTTTMKTTTKKSSVLPTMIPFRPLKTNSSATSLLTALLNMFEKPKLNVPVQKTTFKPISTTIHHHHQQQTKNHNHYHQNSQHTAIQSNPSILDTDYNYDYDEPTLPPSLPNLHIIPFVPDDAVELRTEDLEKYPSITEQSSIDRYDDVAKYELKDVENRYDYEQWKNYYSSYGVHDGGNMGVQKPSEHFSPPLQIEGGFVPKEQPSLSKLENIYITTSQPISSHHNINVVKKPSEVYEKTVEIAYGVQPKPFTRADIEVVSVPKLPTTLTSTSTMNSWQKETITPPPFKVVPEVIKVNGNRRVTDFLEPDLIKNDLHIGEILVGHNLSDYKTQQQQQQQLPSPSSSAKPEIHTKPITNPLDSLLRVGGCNIYGEMYNIGDVIEELSDDCSECKCTDTGVQCNYNRCK